MTCLAYLEPDPKAHINKFSYTKNGGISEFERGVNGNLNDVGHLLGGDARRECGV